MLTKILVPTDLSTESNSAFPHAVTLAQAFGSKLYLVHVMDPDSVNEPERLEDFPKLSKFMTLNRDAPGLPPLKRSVSCAKIYTYSENRAGTILETAKKKQVDLICMASTKSNVSLAWWSAGPVLEKIVNRALCSVLCMRGRNIRERDWQRPNFKHILLLVDMEAQTGPAFAKVVPWIQTFDSMLHVFPLQAGDTNGDTLNGVEPKIAASRAEVLSFPNPSARMRNLLDFLGNSPVDMVAMLAGVRSKFSNRLANDILVRLLRETDCPVLILR